MFRTLIPSILALSLVSPNAFAAMSRDEYLAALKIAQQKVERERAATASQPGALSSSLLGKLLGRYYQVGDRWQVAAWNIASSQMRRVGAPEHMRSEVRKAGLFQYEVIDVSNGSEPRAVIRVTQLMDRGMKAVDPKVEHLTLTMNDKMIQSQKSYKFQGQTQPVKVPPNGIRTHLTQLELFPLDVPELLTAVEAAPTEFPELPAAIRGFADLAGIRARLAESLWYEQDDFFGRPIQALWERGKPWPTYFKTPNGIALLVKSELR